ncbi:MAG: hypothetical protein COW00_10255 [Bdellovibrio sp. CG12_big_fil_rev_8_21_14_0_65_39_13]|nr:MAG: hypothetical protein COW78_01060 [Bdellovibrio sp. CG22_combo_CG10-13_8_21_14_all_39_27]PIQ59493.1 MAG: hypothetical protein COW00_10255 [Bdellovibrio sp. CG12_big_fil_rev_8_21_14_0_65_39_13]PIR33503.1 MAG: hypothetical protein COV37_16230 [Bdellovibrio sp. CG11_big_fil_rev_8_21_14_0_20_39_38]
MKWIDIHRHSEIIQNEDVITVLNLDKDFQKPNDRYFTVGIHPWWIEEVNRDEALKTMIQLAQDKNFICFGEMGIDRAIEVSLDTQIKVFEVQLELASEYSPHFVIIHCVRAFNEILGAVKRTNYKGTLIFHDYNASEEITKELLAHDYCLSFGRHLFNDSTKAYKQFKNIPVENIFLECDDWKDMTIQEIYQKASEIKGMEVENLKMAIHKTFEKILLTRKN